MRQVFILLTLFLSPTFSNTCGQAPPDNPPDNVVSQAAKSFHEYASGPTFDQIIASGDTLPDPIVITKSFNPVAGGQVFEAEANTNSHITKLVDRSDIAVEGIPVKRWTYPTVDQTFAFSIYLVHLSNVRILGRESLRRNSDIYIVRAGGPFIYRNHNFRATDPTFQLLHLNEPYFFLGSIVADHAYKVDSEQTLKIEGERLIETNKRQPNQSYYENRTVNTVGSEFSLAWQTLTSHEGSRQ